MALNKNSGKKNNGAAIVGLFLVAGLCLYFWTAQSSKKAVQAEKDRLAAQIAKMEEIRRKNASPAREQEAMKNPSPNKESNSAAQQGKMGTNPHITSGAGNPVNLNFSEYDANGRSKDPIVARSQDAIASFSKESGLSIPLIPGMSFATMDFEEGIGALVGNDKLRGLQLGLFAKRGVVNEEELKAYLSGDTTGIPGLEGMGSVKLGESKNLASNQGSGLSDVKFWQVQNNGKSVFIALIPRSDGQGTYFASIVSSSSHFDDAEEFYNKLYTGIRTSK